MKYSKLSKDVLAVIKPPFWNPYFFICSLLRRAYEESIPRLLIENSRYSILDYGCGVRPYEYLFDGYISKYVGVDIGDNPKANIKIVPGEKIAVNDDEFDIVLSSQVLEHVEDVNQYMNECKRVLKKGGYLLLSTHGTWQYHAAPFDYNRWTCMGLRYLLEKYGFEVEKSIPVLGQLAVTSQLRLSFYDSFANSIGTFGRVLLAPVSVFYQIKMMIEDFLTPQRVKDRDSSIFLMIAKKP